MKLYGYYRSSTTYRVRIALNLKGIEYEQVHVHLLEQGGEQHSAEYGEINAQPLVPALVDGEKKITQSLAIMEYLEEMYPEPALLPADLISRAKVRIICQIIASDIHPLNNLRTTKYLLDSLGMSESDKISWYHHWLKEGFSALEKTLLSSRTDDDIFCYGKTPTFADICLVPQVYNAIRFQFSMDEYPLLKGIYGECLKLEPFQKAAPTVDPGFGFLSFFKDKKDNSESRFQGPGPSSSSDIPNP